jgi:hypothetical protein
MRDVLCIKCAQKHLPTGTRQIYPRSALGEPAEFQRLVLGKAKQPTQENRYIAVDGVKDLLDTSFWNCDTCNAEIRPGEPCACWSVWREDMQPIGPWEDQYIEVSS